MKFKPWIKIGVYCIINLINNKVNIGSSNDVIHRWSSHKRLLRINKHYNKHLQSAWNKYGKKNFKFELIEECDIGDLREREAYYIEKYDALNPAKGYNILLPQECFPSNEKEFEIVDPCGNIYKGKNISKFARDHELNKHSLLGLINGHGNMITYKGWTLPGTKLPEYTVISPTNQLYTVKWNQQSSFCRLNGLTYSGLCELLKGKFKKHRGWKLISKTFV